MLLQRTEPHARRAAPRMRRESGVRCSCRARALSLRARAEAAQPGLLPEAALARRVVHRRSQRRRRAATSLGRTYESQERMRRIQSVAHGWTCVRGEGANVVTSRGRVFWGLRRAGAGGVRGGGRASGNHLADFWLMWSSWSSHAGGHKPRRLNRPGRSISPPGWSGHACARGSVRRGARPHETAGALCGVNCLDM